MVTLGVDSALELYTTIIGWRLYNDMWQIVTSSGLVYLPFLGFLLTNYTQLARSQTNRDITHSFLRRIEIQMITAFVVILVAGQPVVPLKAEGLQFRQVCNNTDGAYKKNTTKLSNDPSFYKHAGFIEQDETTLIPAWWYAVMAFSSGFTYSVKEGLPCKDDLVALKFNLAAPSLSSDLLFEIREFLNQCYLPTYSFVKFASNRVDPQVWRKEIFDTFINDFGKNDLEWFGNTTFLRTPGPFFYNGRFSEHNVAGFDKPVSCAIWYAGQGATPGIHQKIIQERNVCINEKVKIYKADARTFANEKRSIKGYNVATPELLAKHTCVRNLFNKNDESNNALYYSMDNLAIAPEKSYWEKFKALWNGVTARLGTLIYKLVNLPVTHSLQKSMPIGITIILMALYIVIPFGLVFSSYSIAFLVTCSVGMFALKFTSYLFYLAAWITNNLISVAGMTFSDTSSYTANIYKTVANSLFLVFPLLFIAIMGWAGIQIGFGLQAAYDKVAGEDSSVTKAAQTGGEFVQKVVETALDKVTGKALTALKAARMAKKGAKAGKKVSKAGKGASKAAKKGGKSKSTKSSKGKSK